MTPDDTQVTGQPAPQSALTDDELDGVDGGGGPSPCGPTPTPPFVPIGGNQPE